MSERFRNILIVVLMIAMGVALAVLVATSPTETDRVETIGGQIKCPVCQGESILNSPSEMARDMMGLVAERVADGNSDQSIIDELLASYSGAVLLDPPASGATLFLWLAPALALVVGGIVIVWWKRHPTTATETPETPSRRRRVAPLLILGLAFAAIVGVAGAFLQDRAGPASGVADIGETDLDDVSNETMEAVIAANVDHPQVDGMRLALAERYFEAGDYRSAFPQYLAVAESGNASDSQAVTALVRLGWMAWEGNSEAEAAIGLFDQALAIDATSATARYLKGRVLWCGSNDPDAAVALFNLILEDPELPEQSRAQVEDDLDTIDEGGACV